MGRRALGVDICQSPIWLKPASMLRRQGIHAAQIAAPRAPSEFWRVPRELVARARGRARSRNRPHRTVLAPLPIFISPRWGCIANVLEADDAVADGGHVEDT
jgi:hypothetical protein